MKCDTKLFLITAGVFTLPCLAGCGGGGGSSAIPVGPAGPLPRSVSVPLPNGLTATVTEDRTSVALGGVVTYTMTLTNNTAQPITFETFRRDGSPTGGVGDSLTVKDAGGGTAFPQGGFAQVLEFGPSTTLAPGQSASGALTVGGNKDLGQFSTTGRYSASVTFGVLTGPGFTAPVPATTGPLEVEAQ
ncbi:MAG: hypothetical protein M3Y35_15225 [Actinomycetota bacterium]|nr:hypothetical protein [Actinomycetota bacterium]